MPEEYIDNEPQGSSVITPDSNNENSGEQSNNDEPQKATKEQNEKARKSRETLDKTLNENVEQAQQKLENAKTEEERKEAEAELEKAKEDLDGWELPYLKLIREKEIEGKKEIVLVPYNTLKEGTQYRGGEIELTTTHSDIMRDFVNKHPELREKYLDLQQRGTDMPGVKLLCDYINQLEEKKVKEAEEAARKEAEKGTPEGTAGDTGSSATGETQTDPNKKAEPKPKRDEISKRLFASAEEIRQEAKEMTDQMVEIFTAYQKERYDLLKRDGMNDFEAQRLAFEDLSQNLGKVVETHSKFAAMLQGNDLEKEAASVLLAEIWTEASAEYRMSLDEEIKKLNPEQLRKIGEAKQMLAQKNAAEAKQYLNKIFNNDNEMIGLMLTAGFFPPLAIFALMPAIINIGLALTRSAHANRNQALIPEYYTKLDERTNVMAAINVSDALLKSYIDLNKDGRGTMFLSAVNKMMNPETGDGLFEMSANFAEKLKGPMKNNFGKMFEVNSDEEKAFRAAVIPAYREINKAKQALIKDVVEIEKEAKKLEVKAKIESVDTVKEKLKEVGANVEAPMSESVLKMIKKDNWFIDSYTPYSTQEIYTKKIEDSKYKDDRGCRAGATTDVIKNFLGVTVKSSESIHKAVKTEEDEVNAFDKSVVDFDMKARLLTSFDRNKQAEGQKVGLGFIRSAFNTDYLANAVNNKVEALTERETEPDKVKEIRENGQKVIEAAKKFDFWTQVSEKAGYKPDSEIADLMKQYSIAAAIADSYRAQAENIPKKIGDEQTFGDWQIKDFYVQAAQEAAEIRDSISAIDDKAFEKYAKASEEVGTEAKRNLENYNIHDIDSAWEKLEPAPKEEDKTDSLKQARRERGNKFARSVAMAQSGYYVDPNQDRHIIGENLTQYQIESAATLKHFIDTAGDLDLNKEYVDAVHEDGAMIRSGWLGENSPTIENATDDEVLAVTMGANESRDALEFEVLSAQEVGLNQSLYEFARQGGFDPTR